MAHHKLKDLEVTNVDFVTEGANKRADVLITKGRKPNPMQAAFNSFARQFGFAGVVPESVRKSATSFDAQMTGADMDRINSELWKYTDSIHASLWSILTDDSVEDDQKQALMEQSIDQFAAACKDAAAKWTAKQSAITKSAEPAGEAQAQKGELEDMIKIDKSKFTDEELKQYEALISKAQVEVADDSEGQTAKKAPAASKQDVDPEKNEEEVDNDAKAKKPKACKNVDGAADDEGAEDIYKGLNPIVRQQLEELKKMKEDIETERLTEVAKKYEVIGKKTDELVPMFKSLKAAGGTAYDDVIALLDSTVSMQQESGLFDEVGKSSHGIPARNASSEVEQKIDGIAKGYMEKDPGMSKTEAIAKAWESNPDLYDEYEKKAGF